MERRLRVENEVTMSGASPGPSTLAVGASRNQCRLKKSCSMSKISLDNPPADFVYSRMRLECGGRGKLRHAEGGFMQPKPPLWKESFFDIFNLLAVPSEVFNRLRSSPRFGVAFWFMVLTFLLCQWFMIPIMQQPMRHIYADIFGEEAADAAISSMMKFFLIVGNWT